MDLHSFHVNLYPKPAGQDSAPRQPWGRCIFYVSDVDAVYALALERGLEPEFATGASATFTSSTRPDTSSRSPRLCISLGASAIPTDAQSLVPS